MSINKFNSEGYYDPTAYEAMTSVEKEERALRAFRPIVYICSPYAGDVTNNVEKARQYRKNAKFLMNDATVALLRKLKDQNGQYLWQPSVQAGVPDRLVGYEIYTSPYVPVAQAGALAIAFGDFKNYWIGDRAGRTVQRLNELYATNGQIGYVATERVDGKVILPEAIQLLQMKSA